MVRNFPRRPDGLQARAGSLRDRSAMLRWMQRAAAGSAAALILAIGAPAARGAEAACDRTCLKGFVDQYLDALAHHDPSRMAVAAGVRFTENGARVPLGEALW